MHTPELAHFFTNGTCGRNPRSGEKLPILQGIYRHYLRHFCEEGENKCTYRTVARLDAINMQLWYRRVCMMGEAVAEAKMEENPDIKYLPPADIRKALLRPERETEIVRCAISSARTLGIPKPELAGALAQELIDQTLDVEVWRIQNESRKVRT
jgi:chorismate mutase